MTRSLPNLLREAEELALSGRKSLHFSGFRLGVGDSRGFGWHPVLVEYVGLAELHRPHLAAVHFLRDGGTNQFREFPSKKGRPGALGL